MPPSMLKETQARSLYSPKPIEFAPGTQINPHVRALCHLQREDLLGALKMSGGLRRGLCRGGHVRG